MNRFFAVVLATSTLPLAAGHSEVAHAARVFVVNSTADRGDARLDGVCQTSTGGECTLRAALTEATAVTSEHVAIHFNIPGSGVRRIRVFSRLPLIDNGSAGITIDGFSQPGSQPNSDPLVDNAVRLVEIVGNGPNGHDGIIMLGSNNVLRGMVVRSFKRAVRISGRQAMFNVLVGNIVGLQANGAFDPTYTRVVGSPCVDINNGANRNRVGMPGNANRNVISGCYEKAVTFYNEATWQNYVQNNILGLDPTGTQRRQNDFGVDINWSANGNIVGGLAFQERNLISGNINAGVEISHGVATINNKVIGNLIGTDPTGNSANAQTVTSDIGVRLEGAPNCATTSRPCPLDASKSTVTDNVIVNSQWGGILVDKGTHHSTIARNRIGVTLNGTVAPNTNFGIRLAAGAQSMMIGPDNLIVGSTRGVEIVPFSSQPPGTTLHPTHYNTITRNSIDDTTGFGIDFHPFGQVNSPGNAHPSVNEAVIPPALAMEGTSVRATTCASCTVEIYRTTRAPGGHGPGIAFISSAIADGNGVAMLQPPTGGWSPTVTATTRTTKGSTSEFSTNIATGGTNEGAGVPPGTGTGGGGDGGSGGGTGGDGGGDVGSGAGGGGVVNPSATSTFVPTGPSRVMDTRDGTGVSAGFREPGSSVDLALDVPADATAVVLNTTITESADAGYVQVYPTGNGTPGASSNLNVPGPGSTIANLVIVPVGGNRSVTFFTHAGGHLVADLFGYFVPAGSSTSGRLVSLPAPDRVLDTRDPLEVPNAPPQGTLPTCSNFGSWAEANDWFWTYKRHGDPAQLDDDQDDVPCEALPGNPGHSVVAVDLFKLERGGTFRLPILTTATPSGGVIPPGATSVVMNVTVVESEEPGYAQVYTEDTAKGRWSNLNFGIGDIAPNLVVAPIGADGSVTIYAHSAAHVVVDVIGYFTGGNSELSSQGLFVSFSPLRLIDSREHGDPLPAKASRDFDVALMAGIHPGAMSAMFINATIVDSLDAGYMQLFPTGLSTPGASSSVNVTGPNQVRPNAVISGLNSGWMSMYLHAGGHFIFDAAGYFTTAS